MQITPLLYWGSAKVMIFLGKLGYYQNKREYSKESDAWSKTVNEKEETQF